MKKIISLLIIVTTLFALCTMSVSAAREEEFLSDVALIYEDSVEDALEEIEGTDWKLFEQDLNPKADYIIDDGVYLIYKTSTNVEDAITDLRVMDMYGGFSISNYEKQLEASRDDYEQMMYYLRVAIYEFNELYIKGDEMAKIAYRQMNYYKDSDTQKRMGDFFLGHPSEEELVTVMMEGNTYVVTNLITLLAVAISGGGNGTLAQRITANYENKDAFNSALYYDVAKLFIEDFVALVATVKRYDALADQYDLADEEIGEEEYDFLRSYASVALALEQIPYGTGTLKDFILKDDLSVQDLCPIIGAFTEGQLALADIGALTTVLQYHSPKSTNEIYKLLDEIEKKLKYENGNSGSIDVYVGVDRSVFEGSFAMTTAAERQQALTGETWDLGSAASESLGYYIAGGTLALLDVVAWGCFAYTLPKLHASALFYQIAYTVETPKWIAKPFFAIQMNRVTYWNATGLWFWTAIGLALIAAGLTGISTWYNYYNPDYTEIPNTLIDVRETDLGDRYIKYTAAKVYGDDGKKNADFNAYEGKEWIALYYTKDATAGNCLTPKFAYSDSSATVARRHQGISMFGESEAFNLNSHVYAKNAPGVYVTMRYSTTEKAAADMPDVVGSIFATGAIYTLTALGGAGLGVGGTILVQNLKKRSRKKSEDEATLEAD